MERTCGPLSPHTMCEAALKQSARAGVRVAAPIRPSTAPGRISTLQESRDLAASCRRQLEDLLPVDLAPPHSNTELVSIEAEERAARKILVHQLEADTTASWRYHFELERSAVGLKRDLRTRLAKAICHTQSQEVIARADLSAEEAQEWSRYPQQAMPIHRAAARRLAMVREVEHQQDDQVAPPQTPAMAASAIRTAFAKQQACLHQRELDLLEKEEYFARDNVMTHCQAGVDELWHKRYVSGVLFIRRKDHVEEVAALRTKLEGARSQLQVHCKYTDAWENFAMVECAVLLRLPL
eukprot:gene6877-1229_t